MDDGVSLNRFNKPNFDLQLWNYLFSSKTRIKNCLDEYKDRYNIELFDKASGNSRDQWRLVNKLKGEYPIGKKISQIVNMGSGEGEVLVVRPDLIVEEFKIC